MNSTPLDVAVEFNIISFVKGKLQLDIEVNGRSGRFGTLLQAAAWNCHEALVRLLMEMGADVNVPSGYYGSAL